EPFFLAVGLAELRKRAMERRMVLGRDKMEQRFADQRLGLEIEQRRRGPVRLADDTVPVGDHIAIRRELEQLLVTLVLRLRRLMRDRQLFCLEAKLLILGNLQSFQYGLEPLDGRERVVRR